MNRIMLLDDDLSIIDELTFALRKSTVIPDLNSTVICSRRLLPFQLTAELTAHRIR